MATATRLPTADRLTFSWGPTFERDFPLMVEVRESRPRSQKRTRYLVQEQEPVSGGRVFLIAKELGQDVPRSDEVYEVFLSPGRQSCTCPGSACRSHAIKCRHVLSLEYLAGETVL